MLSGHLAECLRRVVGWYLDQHMPTQLVLNALEQALTLRQPAPGRLITAPAAVNTLVWLAARILAGVVAVGGAAYTEQGHQIACKQTCLRPNKLWCPSFSSRQLTGGILDILPEGVAPGQRYTMSISRKKRDSRWPPAFCILFTR